MKYLIFTALLFITITFTVHAVKLIKMDYRDANNKKIGEVISFDNPGSALVQIKTSEGNSYINVDREARGSEGQFRFDDNEGIVFTESDCSGQIFISDFGDGSIISTNFNIFNNSSILNNSVLSIVGPSDPADSNSGLALYTIDINNPIDGIVLAGIPSNQTTEWNCDTSINSSGLNVKLFPLNNVKDLSGFTLPFRVKVKTINVN